MDCQWLHDLHWPSLNEINHCGFEQKEREGNLWNSFFSSVPQAADKWMGPEFLNHVPAMYTATGNTTGTHGNCICITLCSFPWFVVAKQWAATIWRSSSGLQLFTMQWLTSPSWKCYKIFLKIFLPRSCCHSKIQLTTHCYSVKIKTFPILCQICFSAELCICQIWKSMLTINLIINFPISERDSYAVITHAS